MGREKATVMVCDNPECRKQFLHEKDEPALGYYFGKGMWHLGGGGGPILATYACSEECILPAIQYNMDPQGWEQQNEFRS